MKTKDTYSIWKKVNTRQTDRGMIDGSASDKLRLLQTQLKIHKVY